jgi:hypothetical protein
MSELDPPSRFFMSDYQQDFLASTPLLSDSMDTDQVTTNLPTKYIQDMQGGNLLISHAGSRDHATPRPSAFSDRSGAWGCSDFTALGTSLSTIGREIDVPAIASSFAFPGQFQSWATQQPPGFQNWNSISDHPFLPINDENSVRSVEVFWVPYLGCLTNTDSHPDRLTRSYQTPVTS